MRRNLSPKIQPIRPNSINHQADCCTAQHDKAQFQIIIAAFHHKPDHKNRNPCVPQKIWNHEPFTKWDPVINRTMNDHLRFLHHQLQKPKTRQKYKQIQSHQRIFMCFDPMKHTAHDSFPFQLLSQTTVISLCSL